MRDNWGNLSLGAIEEHSIKVPQSRDDILTVALHDDSPFFRFLFDLAHPGVYVDALAQCKGHVISGTEIPHTYSSAFLSTFMVCEVLRFASTDGRPGRYFQPFMDMQLIGVPDRLQSLAARLRLTSSKRSTALRLSGRAKEVVVDDSSTDPFSMVIYSCDNVGFYFQGSSPGYYQTVLAGREGYHHFF